jgi:2-polyprenyl-6-methoxyphenol hydroxylase-like FAD-dependent oxidoreductase
MDADRGVVDVCVRGLGIVGACLAIGCARLGLSVRLQSLPPREPAAVDDERVDAGAAARADIRAYSINPASKALLEQLGVWARLPADAVTPVHDIRVRGDDGTAALEFSAWQQCVDSLACIVDAGALEAAAVELARASAGVHVEASDAAGPARLLAVCEGRLSDTRAALGVSFVRQAYGQTAIAARLSCEHPHVNVAHQWFRAPDVLALLPMDRPEPGHGFALVWSLPTERAHELMALTSADFDAALFDATRGEVGRLHTRSALAAWPLALGRAQPIAGEGFVMVGDAAHQIHPLAGQGLNLGLADVASLTQVLSTREPWRSVGDARLLQRHVRRRAAPVAAMSGITDALHSLFAQPSTPVRVVRNRGMALVDRLAPVKRWLVGRASGDGQRGSIAAPLVEPAHAPIPNDPR